VFGEKIQDFPRVCEKKQKYSHESAEKPALEQITTSAPDFAQIAHRQQTKCHRSTFSLSSPAILQKVVRNPGKMLKRYRINSQQKTPSPFYKQ
jgi:hypothetical protein